MATLILKMSSDRFRPRDDRSEAWAEVWLLRGTAAWSGPYRFIVKADRSMGQSQYITVPGDWTGLKQIDVYFINDAYQGPGKDRNLYVMGATLDGVELQTPVPALLLRSGDRSSVHVPDVTSNQAHPAAGLGYKSLAMDATFGRVSGNIRTRADLFGAPGSLAYPWYIYNGAEIDDSRRVPNGVWNGATGDGADGLYGNYRSRHGYFDEGTPQDLHLLGDHELTLRAWAGLNNGDAGDVSDGNIVSGLLRMVRPVRRLGCYIEICCNMPPGWGAWNAFWLNGPGEQAPWTGPKQPGKRIGPIGWEGEIDVFDQHGRDDLVPGHALIAATPMPRKDNPAYGSAYYALPDDSGPRDFDPFWKPTPGIEWKNENDTGWFAHTVEDTTKGFHTYGLHLSPDNKHGFYFDNSLYRVRSYRVPPEAFPLHLIASLQIGPKFNDCDRLLRPSPNDWDWKIKHIRVYE